MSFLKVFPKQLVAFWTFLTIMGWSLIALAETTATETMNAGFDIRTLFIPGIIVVCVIAVMLVLALFLRNYIKVPPNKAAIISGRKHKIQTGDKTEIVGFRIVKGGATFKIPFLESVGYLDLNILTLKISTQSAITKEGVPVSVDAVANVKIGGDEVCLRNAAENLLGLPAEKVIDTVTKTLEAHLRTICGTLSVEQINSDRQAFSQKVASEAAEELRRIGIVITGLPVQHISDNMGYINSLGMKKTAEVKKDAAVGEAEATRDKDIKTAEAKRDAAQQGTKAEREGAIARNENLAQIAAAERDMKIKKADYDGEVAVQEAKRDQAGPKAKAEAEKDVFVAQVAAQEAKIVAETAMQEKIAAKTQQELEATVIKPAEAAKKRVLIDADAAKQKATIDADASIARAEGEKKSAIAKAEGEKQAAIASGEGAGQKAKAMGLGEAESIKAKLLAEAEGQSAQLRQKALAEADGSKAKLLAEAEGLKAKLLAEGEGQLKMAEALKARLMAEAEGSAEKAKAYKLLDEAGRFMFILQAAPGIIEAVGVAAEKALTPAFQAMGAGMANIDKVTIVDTGSKGGTGGGISNLARTAPSLFFEVMQMAQSQGLDFSDLLKKVGVRVIENIGIEAPAGDKSDSTPAS